MADKETQHASEESQAWPDAGALDALGQVAELLQMTLPPLEIQVAADGHSFRSSGTEGAREGVLAVRGDLTDEIIQVGLELVRAPRGARVPLEAVCAHLASLNEKCRIAEPVTDKKGGTSSIWVEMHVKAEPMAMARQGNFTAELEKLDVAARHLQGELPRSRSRPDIEKLYKRVSDRLEPILPLEDADLTPEVLAWAREGVDFLLGGASVALSASFPLVEDYALAALATAGQERDLTFGRLLSTMINAKSLADMARHAPGVVVAAADSISLGTNRYEIGKEIPALLSTLAAIGRPAVVSGNRDQLQAVFSGGQGGVSDPLRPVVHHAPEVELPALARFAVRTAGRRVGGLPPAAEDALSAETLRALADRGPAERTRTLAMVATRLVSDWAKGTMGHGPAPAAYAERVGRLTETLAGLSPRPRGGRGPEVQERYVRVLAGPDLLPSLQDHLLGQDRALGELAARLRMEALTRPQHQPLRYCAQGTPGTGKSESAVLLARQLGIPYLCVDAASMPDYYCAAAQLLGSGRGIVGSHESGRLEQAAKHHAGALIEVCDLDHASPQVRSYLGDLFLQVMETGEGQSAAGGTFSCASCILAFTLNLPGGKDEKLSRAMGFRERRSPREVRLDVEAEIKHMLSGAFLSRVGTPILFDTLGDDVLAAILERAIASALRSAGERTHLVVHDVAVEDGLGRTLVGSMDRNITAYGARTLHEHGRSLAAEAFATMERRHPGLERAALRVRLDADGALLVEPA